MSWKQKTWAEEQEVFAADMNNIEEGIAEALAGSGSIALTAVEELNGAITSLNLRAGVLSGLVVIVGGMEFSTELAASTHLFTLPTGMRPEKTVQLPITYAGANTIARGAVIEASNGFVKNEQIWKSSAAPIYLSAIAALK